MEPDVAALPGGTGALYRALTQGPRRETPDPATLALLSTGLPADLHALLYAWTYFGRPSQNSLRVWSVFETWDFGLAIEPVAEAEMKRVCETLAPGSRRTFPGGPYVQIGFDAGGHFTVFAGGRDGATATFGPEHGGCPRPVHRDPASQVTERTPDDVAGSATARRRARSRATVGHDPSRYRSSRPCCRCRG